MRNIFFIYANLNPSIKMRCIQLEKILSKYYNIKTCDLGCSEIHSIQDSIIFFFKHINKICKKIKFNKLKDNNNIIIFDTIDLTKSRRKYFKFEDGFYNYIDIVITPLIALFRINKKNPKALYIPHHFDIELIDIKENIDKKNEILYQGQESYIEKFQNLLIKVEKSFSFSDFINNIDFYSSFRFHISVYDNDLIESEYKPITKIATAAALGAIPICENSEENIYWLGKDYPFYIDLKNKNNSIKYWIDKIYNNNVDNSLIEKAEKVVITLKEQLNLNNIVNKYYIPLIEKIQNSKVDNNNYIRNLDIKTDDSKLLKWIKYLKKKNKYEDNKNKKYNKIIKRELEKIAMKLS